jgi:hypothetical protein
VRTPHTFPTVCALLSCGTVIQEGLLVCVSCWNRLSPQTRHNLLSTMADWKSGGPVKTYLEARNAALAELGPREFVREVAN